jgi:hypothetical protein
VTSYADHKLRNYTMNMASRSHARFLIVSDQSSGVARWFPALLETRVSPLAASEPESFLSASFESIRSALACELSELDFFFQSDETLENCRLNGKPLSFTNFGSVMAHAIMIPRDNSANAHSPSHAVS